MGTWVVSTVLRLGEIIQREKGPRQNLRTTVFGPRKDELAKITEKALSPELKENWMCRAMEAKREGSLGQPALVTR